MSKRQDRPQKEKPKADRPQPKSPPMSKEELQKKIRQQFKDAFGWEDK